MAFLLFVFALLVVALIKTRVKVKKRKVKNKKIIFYALSSKDRERVKEIKQEIIAKLDNLPNFTKYIDFKIIKNLGLDEKPIYKVDICSNKQFYLYNAAKRGIKKEFNLICLFKRKLPISFNKDVFCFIKRKLALDELIAINCYDVSSSNIISGRYGKLINIDKIEIDKYYTNKFLVSEYDDAVVKFTRNLTTRYFSVESKKRCAVTIGFNELFNKGVGFVKKIKNGFFIRALYENKSYYILTNAHTSICCGVCDNFVVTGKNFEVCVCENMVDLTTIKKSILDSLKSDITVKTENKLFNRVFNYAFPNIIVRNLIVNNDENDYLNYKQGKSFKEFDLDFLNNIYLNENASMYYNYLKKVVLGFSECEGRIKISPKLNLFNEYEIDYKSFQIQVSNNQREVKRLDDGDVQIVNFQVLPKREKGKIKVFC